MTTIKELEKQTDERMSAIEKSVDSTLEVVNRLTAEVSGIAVMLKSDRVDATEVEDPLETHTAEAVEAADGDAVIELSGMADVDSPEAKAKLEEMAFMNEKVLIDIHEVHGDQEDPAFELGVNGRKWVFVRGQQYEVPRYVVSALCEARPVHYTNVEYIDHRDGVQKARQDARRGLRYPFSVAMDGNPRGRDWLKAKLQAA